MPDGDDEGLRDISVPPPQRNETYWLEDAPPDLDVADAFGVVSFVDRLVEAVDRALPPFTMSVSGSWGIGKSTTYDAGEPIGIQWNTPLPDGGSYPVRVELTVETTYDDGTVRTFEFAGSIAVVVVYSAISH